MDFINGVINIQTAAYNGARTVYVVRHTKDKKDEEKGCYFYCVEVPKLI